jgi:hypothetical protein
MDRGNVKVRAPQVSAAAVTALLVLAACASRGPKDELLYAPVPEADRRLAFEVATEGPQALDRALEQAICLVQSSQFDECRVAPQTPDVCNQRTRAEIDDALRPTFMALRDSLGALRLESPSVAKVQLAALLPSAVVTDEVYDARRTDHCREWRSADGTCLGIRVDSLWLLLRGKPAPDGTIQTVEVFLASPTTCTNRLP